MSEQTENTYGYPYETIDLPSKGLLYPEDSILRNGKLDIKYMTAKEEDILTSTNLLKKGVALDRLINSLILTPGVKTDDLILGDKNAVMVAARILAYGPEYACEVTNPKTGANFTHTFDLTKCPFKSPPEDIEKNEFEMELPISKQKVKFKVLTGADEVAIEKDLKNIQSTGVEYAPELTTRLRYVIVSVDDKDDAATKNALAQNMLARDSLFFRKEIERISPDIILKQQIDIEGEMVEVVIPMTASFFWPKS